ncbi:MAG TPA: hypothetical protein VIK54_12095 [Acidimicrobiia bacterium]
MPPLYVANGVPSIERSTDVARLAAHFSSIWVVGALHETGEDGLTVKSLIRTLTDCLVVVVCGRVLVVLDFVVDDDASVVVGVDVVVELEVVVTEPLPL